MGKEVGGRKRKGQEEGVGRRRGAQIEEKSTEGGEGTEGGGGRRGAQGEKEGGEEHRGRRREGRGND